MAVAFDAVGPAGGAGTNSNASPLTWTHICGGSATAILIAATSANQNTNQVTAVTYGGVTCTQIGTFVLSGNVSSPTPAGIALYYLDSAGGLPTGSNTVSVTFTDQAHGGSADTIGGSISVTGSSGHGSAFTANPGSASSASVSVTGTTTGGMIVPMACFGGGAGGGTFSGTNSVTVQWSRNVSTTYAGDNAVGGTVASTGGGASQTVGFSNTQTDNWGLIAVELLPGGPTQGPALPQLYPARRPAVVVSNAGWRGAQHSRLARRGAPCGGPPGRGLPVMATITHAGATWTTTAGNKTVTATPAAGDLIVIVAPATGVVTSAVSDNNADGLGAYTQVDSDRTGWSTTGHLSVWVRNALVGSGTSTVFTATQASSTGGGLDVFRVAGMTKTGSSAVRSSGGQSTGTAGTTPAPVLSLTPVTFNPIITAVCNGTNPGGVTIPGSYSAGSGSLGYATPTSGMVTAFINAGITNATITWGGTSATAFGSVAIELDTGGSTGPLLDNAVQSPAGLIVSLVRTGVAMASLIPNVTVVPPPPPTSGPPFFAIPWPVRARVPQNAPRGRTAGNPGAPVRNPVRGPVFFQATGPCRARIPANVQNTSERVGFNPGAPVRNPSQGPLFRQAVQAVRARLPLQPFLKGRCYSSPGAPLHNSTPGPVFRQRVTPARFILPPPAPRAGRIGSSFGAPVINPVRGPTVYAPLGPSQARRPLPARGRVYTTAKPAVPVVPPVVAPFFPLRQPARSRIPRSAPRGRVWSNPGAPVVNPNIVPVYGAVPGPVRASLPAVQCGRVYVTPAPAPATPPVHSGPPFFPFRQPVQARTPLPRKGRVTGISGGAPVRNPSQGPVFRQAAQPASARLRVLPPRGRITSGPGAPVHNPPLPPVPAVPRNQAVRGQQPQPGGANTFGRAATMVAIPAPVNPTTGPQFRQAPEPVQARRPLPPHGTVASNPGGPVRNPVPGTVGPPFFPFRQAVRIRPSLPPKGRTSGGKGTPVRNPAAGPVFRQAASPARIRIPVNGPRGRTAGSPGGPVHNPPPPAPPQPFQSRSQAVRGQVLPASSANFWGRAATMVALPAPPALGPVFRQSTQPVRARLPLQPFLKGRCGSTPRYVPPPPKPTSGPVFRPLAQVRAKIPPNPRGRIGSNPGTFFLAQPGVSQGQPAGIRVIYLTTGRTQSTPAPVRPAPTPTVGPPFRQATQPARARIPVNGPRGRAAGNPGGLVRNPHPGPVFRQAVRPIRAPIPQNAPRGRTGSNPGGPVENIPFVRLLLGTGQPFFLWQPQEPFTLWDTSSPTVGWQTGVPYTSE